MVRTPGTRLTWSCLADWVDTWKTLQRRRVSAARYQQESAHILVLPLEMIARETDPDVLYTFLKITSSNPGNRPRRGERGGHPTTVMVVKAGNRLAHLSVPPHRQHRRQQSVRQTLKAAPDESEWLPSRRSNAPHLSLF
jgi:hypothetical protein